MEQELVTQQDNSVILQPHETVETRIASEVAKFSFRDAKIQELKEQYGALAIKGVEDKEGYEAVRVALGIVKGARTGFENKRKDLKADYLKIGAAIDAEAKRLTLLIKPLEDKLQSEKDRIDEEKERAKKQKELEEQQKLNTRINELIASGMKFDGSMYAIGDDISIDVVTVKNMPDDKYDNLKQRVEAAKRRLDEEEEQRQAEARRKQEEFEKQQEQLKEQQAEQQRKQQELEDKERQLKQQQKDLEDQQNKLRQQQEEAEKEKERQRQKEHLASIDTLLRGAGMQHHLARNQWYFQNDFGTLLLNHEEMKAMTLPQVEERAKEITATIAKWQQQQTEADEQKRKQQEEEDKKEEHRKEHERVAKLGDVEKVKEYGEKILAIPAPEPFKSAEMAQRFSTFKTALAQLLKNLTA